MNIWLTMLLAGLVTFIIRLSFIWIIGHRSIPPLLRRALRLVPPAVLTAIIFPEVFLSSGQLDLSFGNARLLAAAAGDPGSLAHPQRRADYRRRDALGLVVTMVISRLVKHACYNQSSIGITDCGSKIDSFLFP